jgi:D-glycero-alpha-D-manno-heptose-7-phosphate kinase
MSNPKIKIVSKAPTRIDIAGGTLDLWPIHHLLDYKATVNVGITLEAQVDITASKDKFFHFTSQDQGSVFSGEFHKACISRELPLIGLLLKALWHEDLPPLTIVTAAKSPAGAGLGGSSCLGIAIAGGLVKARQAFEDFPALSEHDLVRTVQDVEARLIHAPTGCQDYWGGIRGQINVISFPFGKVEVETFLPASLPGLTEELIVCYSGKSRASAINNWEIFKRLFDGDKELLNIFNDIGSASEQCGQAVRSGDYQKMLFISQKEWQRRIRLWPKIETTETKRLDQAAKDAGARFSRVCGAGGGGVMAVFSPVNKKPEVCKALIAAGGVVLPAAVSETGLQVESF